MKELYKHLKIVVENKGNNNQYIELANENNFFNLSIKEKLAFVNLILSGRINNQDKIKLRKLAYKSLTKPILDYNLEHLDAQLEFIYDNSHKLQIEKLQNILNFLKEHKDYKLKNAQEISALKGFSQQVASLTKEIGRAFLEINQGPTHVMHEIDFAFKQSFNRIRRYLKMNPGDNTWVNFSKQFAGSLFNISIWLSKQVVNSIRKPIAACVNLLKCLGNLAILKPKKAYKNFKDALYDIKDTAIAWGTVFCAMILTPVVPIAPLVATAIGAIGAHSVATILISSATAVKISAHNPIGIALEAGDVTTKVGLLGSEYLKETAGQNNKEETKAFQILYSVMQHYENADKSNLENYHIKQEALSNLKDLSDYVKSYRLEKAGSLGKIISSARNASSNLSNKLPKRGSYYR